MRTHLKTTLLLLLLNVGMYAQSHLSWRSIDNIQSFESIQDSILAQPSREGRVIAKNIQTNAIRTNDSLLYAAALQLEADINFLSGSLSKSTALYNEALSIYQKYNQKQGTYSSLVKLAVVDYSQGNYFHALNKLNSSLDYAKDLGSPYHAITEYNIGKINYAQGEYAVAKSRLQKAIDNCSTDLCPDDLANAIKLQIALIDLKFDNRNGAEESLNQLKQHSPKVEYGYNLANAKSQLWLQIGNSEKALTHAQQAVKWANDQGIPYMQAEALLQLANVYETEGNHKEAVATSNQVLDIQKNIEGAVSLKLLSLHQLSTSLLSSGDSNKALETFLSYKHIEDSLENFEPNKFILARSETTTKDTSSSKKSEVQPAEVSHTKQPLIAIKGDREKIILGIITVLIIGLMVGLIPLLKLRQGYQQTKEYKKKIKELSENEKTAQSKLDDINKEKQRLEQLDKNKNKVFSILTHDIRQPINQVKSVLDLLAEQSLSADDRKEIVQKLRESLDNSSNALENLLLWSKKQLTGISTKMVDIHLLPQVWQLESQVQENLDAKRIKLDIHIPDFFKVYADMSQLDICMRNLVNNAIKFSNRGGVITIDALEENGDHIVRVIDNGVGMTDEQVHRLMSMKGDFSTLGTMNEKGTGLGVLIVREFMENQNGSLNITSRKGEGSIFSLIFHGKRPIEEKAGSSKVEKA